MIRELQQHDFDILIACNSIQKSVLQSEFPEVKFLYLEGYNLRYGKNKLETLIRLAFQLPKILISINRENLQIKRIILQERPDLIISDNRYGIFSPVIPSVFITHQLNIRTGSGKIVDYIARKFTHRYIRKFTECWIPDHQGESALAGNLSNGKQKTGTKFRLRYLGPLSRFGMASSAQNTPLERVIRVLVILSGPEPQRTIVENILTFQLEKIGIPAILVRGVKSPKSTKETAAENVSSEIFASRDTITSTNNTESIKKIDFANSETLEYLIKNAELVICRSGYTSIMDLAKLKKKTIVVPTPGQAEQEYLAEYLAGKNYVVSLAQTSLAKDPKTLIAAIDKAKCPSISFPDLDTNLYRQQITESLNSLKLISTNNQQTIN